MDGDDTESHFLPPPPGPTAVGARGAGGCRPEGDHRRGGGRRAAGAGQGRAPLRLARAHPPRPARRPSTPAHTRARGRRRPCPGCCSAARRRPSRAQSPGPGRRGVHSSRPPGRRLGVPAPAAARARGAEREGGKMEKRLEMTPDRHPPVPSLAESSSRRCK